ncbi:M36 family metallopeptidase [Jannaschia sp. R86511]|uniref:M36 family metallopeptidase n=1 Tax=Jannaschia sp. R86511 TaxID=3093853 RepID=UPI0036D3400A
MRRSRAALLTSPVVLLALLAVPLPTQAAEPGRSVPASGPVPVQPDTDEVERIATAFLQSASADYEVGVADLADLAVRSTVRSAHNGVSHVNVFQRYDGLEVFSSAATVNVRPVGSVLHVGESLVPDLRPASSDRAEESAVEAVASAADALDLDQPEDLEVLPGARSSGEATLLTDGGISDEPIETTLGWQPTEDGLRLAYQVVIDDSTDVHLWNATVDAETGELLDVEDWTVSHAHGQIESTMARGAHQLEAAADHDGHGPSTHGTNDPVDDGSTYRVLEIPKESPNDGPATLVSSPADGLVSPFGWHDTDGVAGPEHTTTRGNNVHAYLDQDADNVPDLMQDVDGGAGLDFDFEADLTEHAQDYREAATTNLFYMNNVIHDVMALYGFDEEAGNFQAFNYAGGPGGGDYVRAEAADGNGTNNANFSTPAADGSPPRMQMYLWPGNQFGAANSLTVDGTTYPAGWARFGPPVSNAALGGQLVLAGNGCVAEDYPAGSPAGFVAVVEGPTSGDGSCSNVVRTLAAQAAGASAVVVVTTGTATTPPILTGSQAAGPVGIPAVSVNAVEGEAVKAAAGADAEIVKAPGREAVRDGDLENGIIIHEYGHGISNRLTGGLNVNCLSGQEQMGEGWSDYYGITMLLDPTLDDPEGARGMGPYALFQGDRTGNGIRPRPYSRNMEIQPFTYDRIKTNSWITGGSLATPHGVGHGWNSVLWDLTWNLIDAHGFNDNIYDGWDAGGNNRSLQYVTDGLKMQGCAPGFVAGRDGILAATEALGGADTCIVWSTFARRGLGYSAVQGTTGRDDNTEAFDVPAECVATGDGFDGMDPQGGADDPLVRTAGNAVPMTFDLGGNLGFDRLASTHSFASRQVDCATGDPVQFAVTTPTELQARTQLRYNRGQGTYYYLWDTEEEWAGTCREFVVTLVDGTQHTVDVRLDPRA